MKSPKEKETNEKKKALFSPLDVSLRECLTIAEAGNCGVDASMSYDFQIPTANFANGS